MTGSTRCTTHPALAVRMLCVLVGLGAFAVGENPEHSEHKARVIVERRDLDPLALTVHGRRVAEDGRLRFVGSIDRPDGGAMLHWDLLCDPNPNGGASIEGTFQMVGPFDGSFRLEVPLNPVVAGSVALKAEATLRASADRGGIAIEISRDECAWGVVVDGRAVIRNGCGPLSIERESAGVTKARTWSRGMAPGEDPIIIDRARDRLGMRVACTLAEGASAILEGRIRMIGDPDDFMYRETASEEGSFSPIPRREGGISISVPGSRTRGGRGGRPNKPKAVVRPSRLRPSSPPED